MGRAAILVAALLPLIHGTACGPSAPPPGSLNSATLDLATLAQRGQLRFFNRALGETPAGERRAVRLSAAPGDGVAWIEDINFETGTIEIEARGKDVFQQSFVGIAFGGKDDRTYEAVYLRPFNFRATDPVRRDHAVQYISHPTYTWQKLRSDSPEVYENPVNPAPDPIGWVPMRIVVGQSRVSVYVGEGTEPDLVVDRLGTPAGKRVGLWVGNNSDGDFANLRVTPAAR